MPLNAAVEAETPKEARSMEEAYAKQKQKLAEACLKKYRKNLDDLVKECLDDDQLDLAKEIRTAIKEKRLPAGVENANTDTYFIGEWKEKSGDTYSHVHKWDGKSLKERKYKEKNWTADRKKYDRYSSANVLAFKDGDPWKRCWIAIGPDRMVQLLTDARTMSMMERMSAGEASAPTGSYTQRKAEMLFTRMATDIKDDLEKINKTYAKFLQKKVSEWSKKEQLDLAIWARERLTGMKEPAPFTNFIGEWTIGDNELNIENPKKFERKDKSGKVVNVYVFSSTLNPEVHIYKIEKTGQSIIVARSGSRLFLIPHDLKGQADIARLKK